LPSVRRTTLANALTEEAFKKSFPILGAVFSFWQSTEQKQILKEFNNWVLDFLKLLDQRIDNLPEQFTPELTRVAAVAVERILWGASREKAKQFAAIFAPQFKARGDEQALEDAAYFIRVIDELSEDDIRVLNHLCAHQGQFVVENQPVLFNPFFQENRMKKMIETTTDLHMQRDEFYARLLKCCLPQINPNPRTSRTPPVREGRGIVLGRLTAKILIRN